MTAGIRWSPEHYASHKRRAELAQRKPGASAPKDAPTTFTVKLPYPPTVNHSHELNADGSRRLSDAARAFRENASAIARFEFANAGHATLIGRVSVTLVFVPPDNRRRDVDNPIKQVNDALQEAGVIGNDSQIRHLEATMMDCMFPGEGATHVTVRTL